LLRKSGWREKEKKNHPIWGFIIRTGRFRKGETRRKNESPKKKRNAGGFESRELRSDQGEAGDTFTGNWGTPVVTAGGGSEDNEGDLKKQMREI